MLTFKTTKHDADTIRKIVSRASKVFRDCGVHTTLMDITMDVTATHANGCPLRLEEMLEAGDFDFNHDIFGIRRHLNRDTGQLEDFFVPRFAQPAPN